MTWQETPSADLTSSTEDCGKRISAQRRVVVAADERPRDAGALSQRARSPESWLFFLPGLRKLPIPIGTRGGPGLSLRRLRATPQTERTAAWAPSTVA